MKVCSRCNEEKENDEFPMQSRNTKNGVRKKVRRSECKICYNEYFRSYMKDNKSHTDRVSKGKKKRRDFVKELKIEAGCFLCGYKKTSAALHYHHLKPEDKEFDISWGVNKQLTEEKLLKEIEKCVILCANCHAEVEDGTTVLDI
jgi:hypothetical protein